MSQIEELADRVERLLLRHEEVQRTNALLREQLAAVAHERDNLRSRLNAARSRIDVLLERLPRDGDAAPQGGSPALVSCWPACRRRYDTHHAGRPSYDNCSHRMPRIEAHRHGYLTHARQPVRRDRRESTRKQNTGTTPACPP